MVTIAPQGEIALVSEPAVPAAKLHVLGLLPIKNKLGEKWPRLSGLVHSLFEKAISNAQGPSDHFIILDELSYVVSFHHLSMEEAGLACAAIAQEVCKLLFGADVEDISVRSLVGLVSPQLFEAGSAAAAKISELLEQSGGEIIVKRSDSALVAPRTSVNSPSPRMEGWSEGKWISRAHQLATSAGRKFGFFPVWDLSKRNSFSLYASLWSGATFKNLIPVRRALVGRDESQIVEMEAALLFAAADYACRFHAAQKICALGIGVSYETMSGFHTRIRYIGLLKTIQTFSNCPLMIRVEQVPKGTPLGRIAEIVAMMSIPNIRVSLEFKEPRTLPEMNIRLGAMGIGCVLPADCDATDAASIAQRLVRGATDQKGFAFLHGLSSPSLLSAARDNGVRVGSGSAIGRGESFTGLEPLPEFPLLADFSE
jgi:hypothetical protein